MAINIIKLGRKISKYYILSLLIVTLCMLTLLVPSELLYYHKRENTKAVNISGKQRMLSQRIALYANLYQDKNAKNYLNELDVAIQEFEKAHLALTRGDPDLGLSYIYGEIAKDIYFGEGQLDKDVWHYISLSHKVSDQSINQSQREKALALINILSKGPLLDKLDKVVSIIEAYDNKQQKSLLDIQRLIEIVFSLIAFGAIFIFRPINKELQSAEDNASSMQQTIGFLELAWETIPDLVFVKDSEFRIVRCNSAFKNIYPPNKRDKIIGHTTIEDFDPEQAKLFLENDRKALAEGNCESEEILNLPSGVCKTFYTKKVRFRSQGNNYMLGISRDITKLKEVESTLRKSEKKFRETMDHSPVGMALLTLEGRWLDVNIAFCNMLGFDKSELLNTDFQSITYLDDLHMSEDNVRKLLNGEIDSYRAEKRYVHKNKSIIWVTISVILFRNQENVPQFIIAQILDITDQKKILDDLEESNSELEEFAYRTSHDLRSPLISSLGILQIAKEAIEENDMKEVARTLSLAEKSLLKLEALAKDILTLNQVKNAEVDMCEINLDSLISEVRESLMHMQHYSRPEFIIAIDRDVQFFEIQKGRFLSIVENLLSNAIKYQDMNKSSSFIKISAKRSGTFLQLEIEDNGLGIPEELSRKLFKMFQRFHTRTSFGSGLGLYILKKSAEKIGGEVYYKDTGYGSIFGVQVPAKFKE